MQNLNKENFFDKIEKDFPQAFKHFSAWIDKYKKEVYWNILFGNMYKGDVPIKFHDIPKEMQIGIIMRFLSEESDDQTFLRTAFDFEHMAKFVTSVFGDLNLQLQDNGKKRNIGS